MLYESISTVTVTEEGPEFSEKLIEYLIDETGSHVGMIVNGTEYYFTKNLQGDIQRIYTANGTLVGEYHYDAWGNILNESSLTEIAQINPFRYRSYYYDSESGLYYLNSRYYDPETGRFINSDSVLPGVGCSIQGYNVFTYCFNNPVNMTDSTGTWPNWNDIKAGFEKVIDWVDSNIIQPAKSFIEKTIDYLTPPSKEEHYNRNTNNIQSPKEYDETFFKGWDDSVSANCHQFSAPNRDNVKYVSPDGRYEAIYDVNNNLVEDPRDIGTYNFVSPNEDPLGHFIKDVVPWIQYGNSPDDSTEPWQRSLSFIGIYV